jgi:hypothetical protein
MMARILASTESPPRRTPAKGLAQTHVFGSETGAATPSFPATAPHADGPFGREVAHGSARSGHTVAGGSARSGGVCPFGAKEVPSCP